MRRSADHLPDPPPSLGAESAARLTAQTEAALRGQREELAVAIEHAFEYIPWPLRGAVRRALGL
jgi:hypothetical protein